MTFSKKAILLSGILLCISVQLGAQVRQTREEYISRYMPIAIAHMERYGIPASITMAQGILESDCGNSLLSMKSNNHFGIKCKRNWTGDKVYHDDDAKGECFRSYPSVEASYRDHAEFLDSQPRYDSLFAYSSDDYKSWARGLKAAGYATAPDYAQRLIRIIEENQLFLLDRPDGARLYASRYGLKRDPEEWFSSPEQRGGTGPDRGGRRPGQLPRDDQRPPELQRLRHQRRALRAGQGERHVREHRAEVPPLAAQPAQIQRSEGQEGPAGAGRGGLHRTQAETLGGQLPAPHPSARAKRPTPWASPTPSARGRSRNSTSSRKDEALAAGRARYA